MSLLQVGIQNYELNLFAVFDTFELSNKMDNLGYELKACLLLFNSYFFFMEALLLYRAGSNHRQVTDGLKYDGVSVREIMWTPKLNFEELSWTTRTVCIYVDRDSKLLDAARLLKSVHPSANIFLLKDGEIESGKFLVESGVAIRADALPCNFSYLARAMKSSLLNEVESVSQCSSEVLNILLNSDRRTVTLNSHIIPLRNKEYELLEFFVLNKGRLITRHSLIEGVWDRNAKVSSNTLDVHIGRLRKKLEQWLTSKFIHTVHSIGYRFDLDCK